MIEKIELTDQQLILSAMTSYVMTLSNAES